MNVFEGKYLFSFFLMICLFTNQVTAQSCSPCPCSNYQCPPFTKWKCEGIFGGCAFCNFIPWGSCIWAAGARRWKINIATNKTFIIHIGKNNPKDQYKINDNIICEVQSIRDLGIIIDNKLKFTEHISKIVRNTYMRMNLLFKIIKSKSTKTWLTLYKSYIRPLLEYAPEAWNPLQISEIKKLEKCQKYFTKIMLKKCRLPNIPYENRLEYLKIPTLETRRKIFDLVLMYKIINGYTHLNTESFFTKNQKRTRFSQYKIKSKFQNFNSSKSFINRTTKMWNVLDNETLKANSPYNFKNKLKLVLVQ